MNWKQCSDQQIAFALRPAERQVDLHLAADKIAADAFRNIVRAALARLLANQPAAAAGVVEGVHQMRIAIRRPWACLALSQPHLEADAVERFTTELRRLGQVLGEARDWDVFCMETLSDAVEEGVSETCTQALRALAEAEQARCP